MPGAFPDENERKSTPTSSYRRTVSTGSQPASTVTQNTEATEDSDATSIAPDRKAKRAPNVVPVTNSPPSASDSQPRTPTGDEPQYSSNMKAPVVDVGGGRGNALVAIMAECGAGVAGRMVLQDLGEVLEGTSPVRIDGVQTMPHNFYDPQPVKSRCFCSCSGLSSLTDWLAI